MKVAIIGSGFSGALTATQLLRNFKPTSSESLTIDLYEKGEKNARGVAYSTESDVHYLNVPAGKMTAFPDDPDHFLRWLEETGQKTEPTTFVRRKVYAKYLEKILVDAERQAAPAAVLNRRFQEIVQWTGDLAHGNCDDDYAAVVLATGNFPPRDVPVKGEADFYSSARYIRDPWQPGGLEKIEKDQPVLLLGTGLTMVDVALELQAKGHRGVVFALSRHGYLPQVHRAATSTVSMPKGWETEEFQVREIFSWLRSFEDQWRPAIDSLRLHTQSLWKRLSDRQRARFFRHCRILWDVHRHRIAPQVGEAVARMIADQKLKPLAGRLIHFKTHFKTRFNQSDSSSVEASYAPRDQKSGQCTLTVGYVINCTGPNNDYSQINSPLIRDLKKKHLISAHPTRLGLQVADSGALIDEAGLVSPRLYAIGSARQGSVWETIAVPELRVQAQELALLLLKINKSDTI